MIPNFYLSQLKKPTAPVDVKQEELTSDKKEKEKEDKEASNQEEKMIVNEISMENNQFTSFSATNRELKCSCSVVVEANDERCISRTIFFLHIARFVFSTE